MVDLRVVAENYRRRITLVENVITVSQCSFDCDGRWYERQKI